MRESSKVARVIPKKIRRVRTAAAANSTRNHRKRVRLFSEATMESRPTGSRRAESRRIPLFPLGTVLFPGMPLPLHVFEPRYQELVRGCLEGDRTFGGCLIRSGQEVGGPADPYPVGTTCEILQVDRLDGGRLRLAT